MSYLTKLSSSIQICRLWYSRAICKAQVYTSLHFLIVVTHTITCKYLYYHRKGLLAVSSSLHQAAKLSEWALPTTTVTVGQNQTRVSFGEWTVSADAVENLNLILTVASLGTPTSGGKYDGYGYGDKIIASFPRVTDVRSNYRTYRICRGTVGCTRHTRGRSSQDL